MINSEKRILTILQELRPEFNFEESNNFIEDGLLDSFDMVSLVTELENQFSCIIDALDIMPENFDTVKHILEVVKKNGGTVK